jgi:rubredoxin
MTWKCSNCGYTLEAQVPPEQCPECMQKCEFVNTTCYIPDCGGPEHGGTDGRI